jgi:hypothetical protein
MKTGTYHVAYWPEELGLDSLTNFLAERYKHLQTPQQQKDGSQKFVIKQAPLTYEAVTYSLRKKQWPISLAHQWHGCERVYFKAQSVWQLVYDCRLLTFPEHIKTTEHKEAFTHDVVGFLNERLSAVAPCDLRARGPHYFRSKNARLECIATMEGTIKEFHGRARLFFSGPQQQVLVARETYSGGTINYVDTFTAILRRSNV